MTFRIKVGFSTTESLETLPVTNFAWACLHNNVSSFAGALRLFHLPLVVEGLVDLLLQGDQVWRLLPARNEERNHPGIL